MDDQFTFDNSSSMYSFFEDLDGEDSGMEDLPFSNYVELEGIIERAEADKDNCKEILGTGTVFDKDEDELAFIDDDKDEDYKPRKARSISKKGNAKPTKRRHYPNTCFSMNKVLLLTPEKQIISQCDTDSNSSMRHYARKDRTPNTIKKMMERHRESERVRHHSLNESLKDVCMRVPGYDPGAKETKVIQMQRIIGYECFLENTFRHLCDQLGVPAKLVLKMNTQFISDALNNTPIEDFYQPSSYKTSDGDDEEDLEEDDRILTVQSRENDTPIGCRLIRSSNAEDNLLQYPREKISSPTVDSTTDNNIRLTPLPNVLPEIGSPTPRYITKYDYHSQWKPQTGFKPVGSSQGMHSSQESGIKIETQSSLEDDYHFHEMNSLIEESLYDSEQLRTVTPSFMREETVTTSTGVEESDEGFDLSSPIRNRESVFLHSPPLRGIWHSANKYHLLNKVDTPKRKEMETVSPENILETKPKDRRIKTAAPGSTGFHSTIRPMTEILSSKEKQTDNANISKILDVQETVEKSSDNCFTRVSANNHTYLRSSDKAGAINNVEDSLHLKGLSGGPNPSVPSPVGQIIKTTQMKNVKVRIIHASPSQRNQQNKLTSLTSVSSTSAALPFTSVSSKGPEVVHMTPSLFSQTQQFITKKENYSTILDNQHGITQLKRIPVPVVTALHELPVPVGSPLQCGVGFGFPLQCGVGFGSPELKNKRKRYTPYRSPFLDRTNQESDDESWTKEHKKRKLEEQESVPSSPNMLTRSRREPTVLTETLDGPDVKYRDSESSFRKVDHRRSTWMNGFMMFSQINRQKFLRDHPGTHITFIQKLMGHKWRSMSYEEQLPYREKASQHSEYIKQLQTCTASVADSSTGPPRKSQSDLEPECLKQEVEAAVLSVSPEYWQV